MVSILEQMQVPNGTGTGVQRSKRKGMYFCINFIEVMNKIKESYLMDKSM